MSQTDSVPSDGDRAYKGVERPWRDVEILHRLYWHEEMTQPEIAEELGCGTTSVGNGMRDNHVPRRTMMESYINITPNYVELIENDYHYPFWNGPDGQVYVHQLLAIAEFGFDAAAGKLIHHGSEDDGPNELPPVPIPWANWGGNLELETLVSHQEHHRKYDEEERQQIADLYENTDMSSRDVASELGCSSQSVLRYHREIYGDSDD